MKLPGETLIYEAHRALEKLILDRDTMHYKKLISERFAELCYDEKWFPICCLPSGVACPPR